MATGKGTASTDSASTPPVADSVEAPTHDTGRTPDEVVAQRTGDTSKSRTDTYVKTYVVPKPWHGEDGDETYQDDANRENTVREMLSVGLRPDGDAQPERVSIEDHPDGEHVILTYACKAIPSGLSMEADVIHIGYGGDVTRPVTEDATRQGEKDAKKDASRPR